MAKLTGKIALITGGTTGIGQATAKLFAQEGATVIATGTNPETLKAARETLPAVEYIQSDSSKLADIASLFDGIKQRHGKLDVLFVNAGIAHFAPLEHTDEAFFDREFALNVKGAYFTLKHGAAILADGGSVILTSSVAGTQGMASASVYAATKAALRSFGRTIAAELAPRNIRVNTLSPGPIETPIFGKTGLPPEMLQEFGNTMQQQVPLKRFGQAHEMATVALFLASADSSYVTGIELLADGGLGSI